jgi:hypothetical protein
MHSCHAVKLSSRCVPLLAFAWYLLATASRADEREERTNDGDWQVAAQQLIGAICAF